jgi:Flp pilus assembly protein TadB
MNGTLLFSGACLVGGGLLIGDAVLAARRPSLADRMARVEGTAASRPRGRSGAEPRLPGWLERVSARYAGDLRRSGDDKTFARLLTEKALLSLALPLVPLLPYAAATGRLPPLVLVLLLAAAGFFLPDLALRQQVKRRRETIFLDLPEAISVLSLALGAGQSLRRALELAAKDCAGPLGDELTRALSTARRERTLDERQALVEVARETGEPTFARFAELLAAKESPYLDFLRQQAAQARAEQNRYLERAADRAYLAMHAPIAPLMAVLVLLIAYGFLRFLAHTV